MFWIRVVAFAQVALLAHRHMKMLEASERSELARLVAKSRGRPRSKLSDAERQELLRLVRKLEPGAFGRGAYGAVRHPTRFPRG